MAQSSFRPPARTMLRPGTPPKLETQQMPATNVAEAADPLDDVIQQASPDKLQTIAAEAKPEEVVAAQAVAQAVAQDAAQQAQEPASGAQDGGPALASPFAAGAPLDATGSDPAAVDPNFVKDVYGTVDKMIESQVKRLGRSLLETIGGEVSALRGYVDGQLALLPSLAAMEELLVAPKVVNVVGDRVWQFIQARVAETVSDARVRGVVEAVALRRGPQAPQVVGAAQPAAPLVRFVQRHRWVQKMPSVAADGSIVLYHNMDPAEASAEVVVPEVGTKSVNTGMRVEVPAGWVAEVTVAGIAGQRVRVATLCGSTHPDGQLMLRLHSNARTMVRAGSELCRLHLHRVQQCRVTCEGLDGQEREAE